LNSSFSVYSSAPILFFLFFAAATVPAGRPVAPLPARQTGALLGIETVLLPGGGDAARPFDAEYDGPGHSTMQRATTAIRPDSTIVFLMAPLLQLIPSLAMVAQRLECRVNRTVDSIARRQRALRAPPVFPLGLGEPGEFAFRTVITPFLI
jgi:hypothetical protein